METLEGIDVMLRMAQLAEVMQDSDKLEPLSDTLHALNDCLNEQRRRPGLEEAMRLEARATRIVGACPIGTMSILTIDALLRMFSDPAAAAKNNDLVDIMGKLATILEDEVTGIYPGDERPSLVTVAELAAALMDSNFCHEQLERAEEGVDDMIVAGIAIARIGALMAVFHKHFGRPQDLGAVMPVLAAAIGQLADAVKLAWPEEKAADELVEFADNLLECH